MTQSHHRCRPARAPWLAAAAPAAESVRSTLDEDAALGTSVGLGSYVAN